MPDHDLVVSRAVDVVGVSGSEDVVCDVAAHAVDIILPLDLCGHALDLAQKLALCEDLSCVNIALNIVLGALPGPCRAKLDTRAGGAVEVRALRARSGRVLAPEVVENFVAVLCMVGVLTAEADLCLRAGDLANNRCSDFGDGYGCQISFEDGELIDGCPYVLLLG